MVNTKSKKGFAAMEKEKVQEIACKGGKKSKEQLGSEGYFELGYEGGQATANE